MRLECYKGPEMTFRPPLVLRSRHVQTVCAAVPAYTPPARLARWPVTPMRFAIEGGALRAVGHLRERPDRTVLLVHGIGGAHDSKYVVRAAAAFWERGYDVVRLNLRGAGDSMVEMPSIYHAGLTSDLDAVVGALGDRPGKLYVVGFSGGGSMALKLAGEWGDAPPEHVAGVAALSAPLDLTVVGPWLDGFGRRPYRFHVMRGLVRMARAFSRHWPDHVRFDLARLSRFGSVRAFDAAVVAPMHGFDGVDAYWYEASAGRFLERVRVPTLFVHADDDPMVPGWTVRPWLAKAPGVVDVHISPRGGHLGWVSGVRERDWIRSWPIERVLEGFERTS